MGDEQHPDQVVSLNPAEKFMRDSINAFQSAHIQHNMSNKVRDDAIATALMLLMELARRVHLLAPDPDAATEPPCQTTQQSKSDTESLKPHTSSS